MLYKTTTRIILNSRRSRQKTQNTKKQKSLQYRLKCKTGIRIEHEQYIKYNFVDLLTLSYRNHFIDLLQINQWTGFYMIGITIRKELKSHPLLVATPQSFEKKIGRGNFYRRKNCRYWFRSSHEKGVLLKDVLRNFAKFTGKYLCQGLFFNKVAGLKPASLLKKILWHRCFSVD